MRQQPFSLSLLSNGAYIDSLYRAYRQNPQDVDPSWQYFFAGIDFGALDESKAEIGGQGPSDLASYLLIQAYRAFGHRAAHINPLVAKPSLAPELQLANFGLSTADLDKEFATHGFLSVRRAPLKRIIDELEKTYCSTVGFDYMGMQFPELEALIQSKIEPISQNSLSKEEKISLLDRLNQSEGFESFLHLKYPGQKRFSVEGGESLIPMLWQVVESTAHHGGERAILGMAHRGRLNILANLMGKSYAHIFQEFESHYIPESVEGSGDVKYHKGYETTLTFDQKPFHLILAPNPSHLEAVDPVVLGMARAFQEKSYKGKEAQVLPILIHGDAAVAGQGIVYECLQMARLEGYRNFGTLHIVINNQIGFTALPEESRSTLYCTDIARAFQVPVFHVNAEDPEKCLMVCKLAVEIRERFGIDVFIDLICYRKYGHNEGDEPAFTQPKIYEIIRSKKNIRDLYIDQLLREKILEPSEIETIQKQFKESLEKAHGEVKEGKVNGVKKSPKTEHSLKLQKVTTNQLRELAQSFCVVPNEINLHPKLKRLFEQRLQMVHAADTEKTIDWGMGEMLAYATLLTEKIHVRISGEDSQRGTFTHRHAVVVDQTTQMKYSPLNHLSATQAPFTAINSLLSEYGVMGFEFGYSLVYDPALVVWEAQFGDFANGAQIIIDQFLASSEQKWSQNSRLTLFLPHGYEGQGPEHSSARIERFLQLAGNDCYTLCNVTHPAQLFHLLRRQVYTSKARPLIVLMPKAPLRYAPTYSSLLDFTQGDFHEILDDPGGQNRAKRLLLCSGKVYYDLVLEREKRKCSDIAILRIEQIYPLDYKKLEKVIAAYPDATEYMWVQEEPENMGAWDFMRSALAPCLGSKPLKCAARQRAASPAAGSLALHTAQYEKLMKDVFYES